MATQYSWTIEWMKCDPKQGDHTEVVVSAGWRCYGVNGQYNGESYGQSTFPAPSGSFTPYTQLTQDQVLQWVWASGVDKSEVEASITAQIESQLLTPVIYPPLPWAQQGV